MRNCARFSRASIDAWIRTRRLVVSFSAVACVVLVGTAFQATVRPAAAQAPKEETWVRYRLPGTRNELTSRWQLLGIAGDQLVIKAETYINGQLQATRTMRRARLRIPEKYSRETIVAAGKKYNCKVFQIAATTFWYAEEVPILGMVRSQNGRDIIELLDFSVPQKR
ncbi:MAG: hypothetical protein HY646_16360 [Acidobacteria bacterium]|nr:hypothetical protein [Acidobacteriota bacterium]